MATRDQPFRFMDLPVELRLMVYEFLPRTIKHTHVVAPAILDNLEPQVELILVTKHVPAAILATCREVHTEANAIVQKIVKRFILDAPPKIIHAFASDHELEKIFLAVSTELMDVRNDICRRNVIENWIKEGHREPVPSTVVNTVNRSFVRQAARVMAQQFPEEEDFCFDPFINLVALEVREPTHDYLEGEEFRLEIYGRHLHRRRCVLRASRITGLPSVELPLSGVLPVDDCEDRLVCGAKLPMCWRDRKEDRDWKWEPMKKDVWVEEWLPSSSGHD